MRVPHVGILKDYTKECYIWVGTGRKAGHVWITKGGSSLDTFGPCDHHSDMILVGSATTIGADGALGRSPCIPPITDCWNFGSENSQKLPPEHTIWETIINLLLSINWDCLNDWRILNYHETWDSHNVLGDVGEIFQRGRLYSEELHNKMEMVYTGACCWVNARRCPCIY